MPQPMEIELKRHYHTLSEKETDEVVDAVAELIVTFLKGKRGTPGPAPATAQAGAQEVQS